MHLVFISDNNSNILLIESIARHLGFKASSFCLNPSIETTELLDKTLTLFGIKTVNSIPKHIKHFNFTKEMYVISIDNVINDIKYNINEYWDIPKKCYDEKQFFTLFYIVKRKLKKIEKLTID